MTKVSQKGNRGEFTIVHPSPYSECMVHFNDSGKVTRLYCYADGIPQLWKDSNGETSLKIKTEPCSNKLFINIVNKTVVFKALVRCGACLLLDEEDPSYGDEIKFMAIVEGANNIDGATRWY